MMLDTYPRYDREKAERRERERLEGELGRAVKLINDVASTPGLPVSAEDQIADWRRKAVES